jgi:hypothetical protein
MLIFGTCDQKVAFGRTDVENANLRGISKGVYTFSAVGYMALKGGFMNLSISCFPRGVPLIVLFVLAIGCGDNNPLNPSNRTEVTEISAGDSSVGVGEGTVVKVNFIFDNDRVFLNGKDINLVARLDHGIEYREESAELSGIGGRDRDVDPRVSKCPNGESFLVFNLGRSELDDAEIVGIPTSAQLKFTVDGVSVHSVSSIEARADEGEIPFDCADNFRSDEQEFISVE